MRDGAPSVSKKIARSAPSTRQGLQPIGEDLKLGQTAKLFLVSIGGQKRDMAQRADDTSDEIRESAEQQQSLNGDLTVRKS